MRPKDVVRAFHAAFVARDVDALCDLYADDAVNHQAAEEPLRGKAAIRKSFEAFFTAFPGETTEMINLFEDGEWAIWEWIGRNPGMEPPGENVPVLHGCGFFQVRRGKIVFQRGLLGQADFPEGTRAAFSRIGNRPRTPMATEDHVPPPAADGWSPRIDLPRSSLVPSMKGTIHFRSKLERTFR